MWFVCRAFALTWLLVSSLVQIAEADEFRSFHIGNSLTGDMWPKALSNRPLHDDQGWHLKCASALSSMLAEPDIVCSTPSEYGYFAEALDNYEWDAVTLQPYVGYGTGQEVGSFVTLAEMTNPDAEILMYATWPWEADQRNGFHEEWYAGANTAYSDASPMLHRRSWYEFALDQAREQLPDREVNLVPVGDVWAALDLKFREGAYEGLNNAGDLYRDGRHANNVGRYVAQTTTWAVMHKQNPVLYPELQLGFWPSTPLGEGSDVPPTDELGELIRQTVWEVISNDPLTGIVLPKGDFNRDGVVSLADYTTWRDGLGSEYAAADYVAWKSNLGNTSGSAASFGDFNRDGVVNLADYTVWRDGLGTQFDAADYEIWKANYGMSTGLSTGIAAGSTSAASVPEPASAAIVLLALTVTGAVARKVSRVVPDPGL